MHWPKPTAMCVRLQEDTHFLASAGCTARMFVWISILDGPFRKWTAFVSAILFFWKSSFENILVCTGSLEIPWVFQFKSLKSLLLLRFCLGSFCCQCWARANSSIWLLHTRRAEDSSVQWGRPKTGTGSRGSAYLWKFSLSEPSSYHNFGKQDIWW